MQKTENTVQKIPEKLFTCLSGNWFGERIYGTSGEFQETVLVQPVKFDNRLIAFGLHRTKEVTEFIVFNNPDPFHNEKRYKNSLVFRISGGEIVGIHGHSQKYYNRLVQPSQKKILHKPGIFCALSAVIHTLDQLTRSYHIDKLPKYLKTSEIMTFEPLTEDSLLEW